MVPVAVASVMRVGALAFESVSVTVSPSSSWASSMTGTETVFSRSPASKVSVPAVCA